MLKATNSTPSEEYDRLKKHVAGLKAWASNKSERLSTSGADAEEMENIYFSMRQYLESIEGYLSTPGIQNYAAEQEANASYDLSAEALPITQALASAISLIESQTPTDADGWHLVRRLEDGELVYRQYAPSDLPQTIAFLSSIAALIE